MVYTYKPKHQKSWKDMDIKILSTTIVICKTVTKTKLDIITAYYCRKYRY